MVLATAVVPVSARSRIFVRMAKAAKRLQAILDFMKKVKLSTSTVFGQFS